MFVESQDGEHDLRGSESNLIKAGCSKKPPGNDNSQRGFIPDFMRQRTCCRASIRPKMAGRINANLRL